MSSFVVFPGCFPDALKFTELTRGKCMEIC
jgi:hypothetical protein